MSSGLYEVLGIAKDASPEQVRKAYKKKALETHPDRLPPGATPAQKTASEDKFRKVNNAYEVLTDPKKRNEYDIHGVWPIPDVNDDDDIPTSRMPGGSYYRPFPHHRHTSSRTFPTPLFPHDPFASFFTDPFTLFNSIFEDMHRHPSGHRAHSHSQRHSPFRENHFDRMQAEIEGFMESIDRDPFGTGHIPRFAPRTRISTFPTVDTSPIENAGGRWVSDSFMSTTVNGVTQTIHKQKDSNGNEHITRTLPDGRKVRTINGVEQPPRGHLAFTDNSKNTPFNPSSENRYLPQPQAVASSSRMDYGVHPQPPPYPSPPSANYHENVYPFGTHERSRRNSDKYSYPSNSNSDERHRKKRWWQGGQ